jgi:hypothetical protein
VSWMEKLNHAKAELAERTADPWRKKLEDAVRGKVAVSTSALLELLRVSNTTANARRVAKIMRSLGFISLKSRHLMPGGFRDTVARGWARPVREANHSLLKKKQTGTAGTNRTGVTTMKYLIEARGEGWFSILNDASDCYVGHVALRDRSYHVENVDNEEIAVVPSLDDAIPAIIAYYEKNPPRWERESVSQYNKLSQFGPLRVEQDQSGQWLAYRNYDYPLLRNGQPAIFATFENAQRAADAHAGDGYPNSETIYDGFAFLPNADSWWSYPNRIAVRAKQAA